MARYSGHAERKNGRDALGYGGEREMGADGEQGAGSSGQNGRDSSTTIFNPFYTGRPRTSANGSKYPPIDRQEIIRRIKSRESRPSSPELERTLSGHGRKRRTPSPTAPAMAATGERAQSPELRSDHHSAGMLIERPRSALHKGDFTEKEDAGLAFQRFGETTLEESAPSLATSPKAPWHPDFPAAVFRQARPERRRPPTPPGLPLQPPRPRATSHASLASSFVYKPPTSPLVQASRPDTPDPSRRCSSRSPDKSRRHTFSPPSLQHFDSILAHPASARASDIRPSPSLRTERTFPYQAHQPRRSLNSFQSLPQTTVPGTRRPSFAESALHHAPMVGSYEESILRGRMSTTPSKPLNFVAQIGVLGKGDCKPNLRCPPHVTVPFPAVYYSYASAAKATDQPSPYVGLVDLENTLPSLEPPPEKRRQKLINRALSEEGSRGSSRNRDDGSASDAKVRRRQRQKQKRRSGSPKSPPGGSYRIPQQGQLQIIIKNPNKTAVKLFLIPYDLSDMDPGQKTFIRQRSYSAGPIVDMPLSSRNNLGTDRPEASLSASDDPNDRPMLRYLIHLHICCPSRGRYFLYKSVRVVFANRVPDGKEKLRNEIQLPEPRYSTYKPGRDPDIGATNSSTTTDAARRRSALEASTPPAHEIPWPQRRRFAAQSLPAKDNGPAFDMAMPPLPFAVSRLSPLESRPASRQQMSEGMDMDSDRSQETYSSRSAFTSQTSCEDMEMPAQVYGIRKLDDPFTFERDRSRERQPGTRSESLLSRRLKDLAFPTRSNAAEDTRDPY